MTITIRISSDLATAIENDRRQTFKAQVDDKTGTTSYVPVLGSITDQILYRLQEGYFRQVLSLYPSQSVKTAQDAASVAQAAADDAARKAATVVKK